MASIKNKIRRSQESRARVKAANKRRVAAIKTGELVLAPRHGKVAKRPRLTWGGVMAKWAAKIFRKSQ